MAFEYHRASEGTPSKKSDISGGPYHCLSSQWHSTPFRSTSRLDERYITYKELRRPAPIQQRRYHIGPSPSKAAGVQSR